MEDGGMGRTMPVPANLDIIRALSGNEQLYFRGRRFKVRPVGFTEGARLSVLEARYANESLKEKEQRGKRLAGEIVPVTVEDIKEKLDILEDTIALFRDLVRPIGLIERLLWRWLKNPFENATEKELGELLGFFFVCRMKSGVRFVSKSTSTRPPESKNSSTLAMS